MYIKKQAGRLFNMSRTLSRGRKRPGPILGWTWSLFYVVNPPGLTAESRVCPTPVLQFNIRPWRSSAGHSVATAGALVILRVSCRACRPCAGATEKEREWAPTASDAAAGGTTTSGRRDRALGSLHHAAERPAPARDRSRACCNRARPVAARYPRGPPRLASYTTVPLQNSFTHSKPPTACLKAPTL